MAKSRRKIQTRKKEEEKVKETNIQQGTGVTCPKCKNSSHVLNSVPHPTISVMGRYRECDVCKTRFYTEEKIERITVPRK